jgi:hypothetical protein
MTYAGFVALPSEVKPLIKQGYIAKQGQEGRYVVYGLTDKGREALARNGGTGVCR